MRKTAQAVVEQPGPGRPAVLEAGPGAARGEHQLEGQPRGVGRDQDGLLVDRHDALVKADLFGDEVLEQVLAHRPRRVGSGALALAGDLSGHEVERVELCVGVLERGPGLAPLVDDQLDIGAVAVAIHALLPNPHRGRPPARRGGRRAIGPAGVR